MVFTTVSEQLARQGPCAAHHADFRTDQAGRQEEGDDAEPTPDDDADRDSGDDRDDGRPDRPTDGLTHGSPDS